MPTNRKRKTREKLTSAKLMPEIRQVLSSGMDSWGVLSHLEPIPKDKWGKVQRHLWVHIEGYFRPCFGDPPSFLPDARLNFLREQWRLHKTEILRWHINEYRDGSRPWGFWMWDAPEKYPAAEDGENGESERRKLRAVGVLLRHGLLSREEQAAIQEDAAEWERLRTCGPESRNEWRKRGPVNCGDAHQQERPA